MWRSFEFPAGRSRFPVPVGAGLAGFRLSARDASGAMEFSLHRGDVSSPLLQDWIHPLTYFTWQSGLGLSIFVRDRLYLETNLPAEGRLNFFHSEIEEFLADEDWAEAFADESYGNTTKEVEAYGVSDAEFSRNDVAEILASAKEPGDYAEVSVAGVFRLFDDRIAAVAGWCDTTGWDCQAGNNLTVAADETTAVLMGLGDSAYLLKDYCLRVLTPQGWNTSHAGWEEIMADWWREEGRGDIADFIFHLLRNV